MSRDRTGCVCCRLRWLRGEAAARRVAELRRIWSNSIDSPICSSKVALVQSSEALQKKRA